MVTFEIADLRCPEICQKKAFLHDKATECMLCSIYKLEVVYGIWYVFKSSCCNLSGLQGKWAQQNTRYLVCSFIKTKSETGTSA